MDKHDLIHKTVNFITFPDNPQNLGSCAAFIWPPCVADADILFCSCGFFYFLLSFCLAYSQRLEIGCRPYFHKRLAKNTGCKNSSSAHHCTLCWAISSQLRHIYVIGRTGRCNCRFIAEHRVSNLTCTDCTVY